MPYDVSPFSADDCATDLATNLNTSNTFTLDCCAKQLCGPIAKGYCSESCPPPGGDGSYAACNLCVLASNGIDCPSECSYPSLKPPPVPIDVVYTSTVSVESLHKTFFVGIHPPTNHRDEEILGGSCATHCPPTLSLSLTLHLPPAKNKNKTAETIPPVTSPSTLEYRP